MSESQNDIPPQTSPKEDAPHRPADDREEIYFAGSPLLRGELGRLFLFGIIGLVLVAIPIMLRINKGDWPNGWVILVLVVLGLIVMFIPWIMTKTMRYRISNYRIDYERGLLAKNIDTLELWHVEDISFHQSMVDRILGVGTIVVLSHDDTTPRLEIKSLPKARPLFDQLKQRIIAVKRQRGVIKMDTGA